MDPTNATTFTLPSDREIVMSRFLDAPRDVVWKAWMDLADAARRDTDRRASDRGVREPYVEVVEQERIVQILRVEGALDSKVVVETVTFEDHGQRTKVTAASRFDSKEHRDSMRQENLGDDTMERMLRLSSITEYAT